MLLPVTGPRISSEITSSLQLPQSIVLPLRLSLKYFRAICWLLINYVLFTYSWCQSRDFPRVTEQDSCARCWLFHNIYKRQNPSHLFYFLLSSTSFYGTCFATLTGNPLPQLSPVHHFLHCSNLHKLRPSAVVAAEKVSLEYSKAQIQGEK